MPERPPGLVRVDMRKRCYPDSEGHPRSDTRCTCHSLRKRPAPRQATRTEGKKLKRRTEPPGEVRKAATESVTMPETQGVREDSCREPEAWVGTQIRCQTPGASGAAALHAQERTLKGQGNGAHRRTNGRAHSGHRSNRTAGPPTRRARSEAPYQRKRQVSRSRQGPVGQRGAAKQARRTADCDAREGGRQHQQMHVSAAGGFVRDASPREPQPRLQGRGWHERWPPPALGGCGRYATALQ